MEAKYKCMHRKVIHLLRKKNLEQKELGCRIGFKKYEGIFILWNSIRRTEDHRNFVDHFKSINTGFMRWNLRKVRVFTNTKKRVTRSLSVFFCCRLHWGSVCQKSVETLKLQTGYAGLAKGTLQQGVINQTFCSFFRQMRKFLDLKFRFLTVLILFIFFFSASCKQEFLFLSLS